MCFHCLIEIFLALIQTEGQNARSTFTLFHDQRDIVQQISTLQRDFLTVDLKHKYGFCRETEAIGIIQIMNAHSHCEICIPGFPGTYALIMRDSAPFTHINRKTTQIGAAITITIMAMAAANTLGIQISLPAAILLSVVSALGACGASGVAGGSLLLIPMACSLFGISNDIAMQVVGVGFIIGVIQDSVETCLHSASDVEFAATAEYHAWLKQGRQLPAFMYSKKERQQLGIEA